MVRDTKHPRLQALIDQVIALNDPITTAVVYPTGLSSISGAIEAANVGIINPIFIGLKSKMLKVAKENNLDIEKFRIIDIDGDRLAAAEAVRMAKNGEVKLLMKGSISTPDLMSAVVSREGGLRTARRISHVFVLDVPGYHKLLTVADAVVNIAPNLTEKIDILSNAVDFLNMIGIRRPKVAILSGTEKVEEKVPSTLDAAAICKMVDRGQISGNLIIDGPLAFDGAISAESTRIKGIVSSVSGDVDLMLVPNLESGNILAKQLQYLSGAESAGVVLGAKIPIVLTSRSAEAMERFASLAVAALFAHNSSKFCTI